MRRARDINTKSQYASDESNSFKADLSCFTDVWFPEDESDVVELLNIAHSESQPVTVSGAGTGLTGARVPMGGGIVMSSESMTMPGDWSREEIVQSSNAGRKLGMILDRESYTAWVPPGITLAELDSLLPRNLMYPPDPTERLASMGGTVATNASGARCFYYGPTREWVTALRIVLSDGDALSIKRGQCVADPSGRLIFSSASGRRFALQAPGYTMPAVKNATGLYTRPGMDLVDLFIGSEGILGIVTGIQVKIIPGEVGLASDLAFFRSAERALDFADSLRVERRHGILALEFFDGPALDFIRPQYPELPEGAGAAVLVEARDSLGGNLALVEKLLSAHGALEDWCAFSSTDIRNMKELRHALPESINSFVRLHGSQKMGTDLAVPHTHFREMMKHYQTAAKSFKSRFPRQGPHCVTYGHVGDCHAHFNFLTVSGEERAFARKLYAELAGEAVRMGGTVSAEHGAGKRRISVGDAQIPYVEFMYGRQGCDEIARVKRALDPKGLLNPGNMIPPQYPKS